jgi:hypothetical protein
VEKGVIEQEGRDEGVGEGSLKRRKIGTRLYGLCRKTGHNARTCPEAADADSSLDSNSVELN